jgi:hypothetical protein
MQHISSYFGFINALRDGYRRHNSIRLCVDLGPEIAELFAHLSDHARGIDGLEFLGRVERRIDLQYPARDELNLVGATLRDRIRPFGNGGPRDAESLCGLDNGPEMRDHVFFEHYASV